MAFAVLEYGNKRPVHLSQAVNIPFAEWHAGDDRAHES